MDCCSKVVLSLAETVEPLFSLAEIVDRSFLARCAQPG